MSWTIRYNFNDLPQGWQNRSANKLTLTVRHLLPAYVIVSKRNPIFEEHFQMQIEYFYYTASLALPDKMQTATRHVAACAFSLGNVA